MPLLSYFASHPSGREYRSVGTIEEFSHGVVTSTGFEGEPWRHDLLLLSGGGPAALLYLSGDLVPESDLPYLRALRAATARTVIGLFGIPNQPHQELREDALIAYSFEQHLLDPARPPLLFPMVQAAATALNVLEHEFGIEQVVVSGASKRGWTAYLLGALQDPRVLGLAPMVFDNLNMAAQITGQLELWGDTSARLDDYALRGLMEIVESPEGQQLVRAVDPFSYRQQITVPTLAIVGSNDPFWRPDASKFYENEMPGPFAVHRVPNMPHAEPVGSPLESLAVFIRLLEAGLELPTQVISRTQWTAQAELAMFEFAVFTTDAKLPPLRKGFTEATFEQYEHATEFGKLVTSGPVRLRRG